MAFVIAMPEGTEYPARSRQHSDLTDIDASSPTIVLLRVQEAEKQGGQ
jgi:hypothetical protein